MDSQCRRCYFSQVPAVNDRFFIEAVRPYCWFAAVLLFLSYVIGLWFTLRTHAAVIWASELDEKRTNLGESISALEPSQEEIRASTGPELSRQNTAENLPRATIRDSQLYKRILGQSLKQAGLSPTEPGREGSISGVDSNAQISRDGQTPHLVPPKSAGSDGFGNQDGIHVPGLSEDQNNTLVRQVAEMAATAAAVAARDATRNPRKTSLHSHSRAGHNQPHGKPAPPVRSGTFQDDPEDLAAGEHDSGGHDAPNWSRLKSAVILCTATVAYAVIAEILVNTVDVVLQSVDIDEKFLGITLFALVPNATEFLVGAPFLAPSLHMRNADQTSQNAISFAMNGNIALSMEIGSAYALQVCLLQIPALVLFSAINGRFIDPAQLIDHTFNLIFPQWDMVTVILCVFLLSYMYGEGKSNYFKGSILVLTYLVVIMGFYFSGYDTPDVGLRRFDTLTADGWSKAETFRTIGRRRSGEAW